MTVRGVAASSGPDFRYIVTGSSTYEESWIVLLDLDAKTAQTVAEIKITVPTGSQAAPSVAISSTSAAARTQGGSRVLIAATESDGATHLFLYEAVRGTVRLLTSQPTFSVAVIASDGSRIAYSDTTGDPAKAGLWVSSTNGGQHERVIADDPTTSPGRPRAIAFSPDNSQIAAVVDVGGQGSAILIAPSGGGEISEIGADGGVLLDPGAEFDWGGAPADAWSWEGVSPLGGGANAVHSFDTRTGNGTLVYRPQQGTVLHDVGRSPRLDRFFTREGQAVIGVGGPSTIWIRTRSGGATKIADVDERGPHSPWWSPDGSRLYAFFFGDDSVGAVGELLTRTDVLTFCIRAPSAPGFVCP